MISCVSSVNQVAAMTWKLKCANSEKREKRVTCSKTQASVEVGKPGTGKTRLTAEKAELYRPATTKRMGVGRTTFPKTVSV